MQDLGVKRVQHGIHASKDQEVLKLLKDEGVVLDICPISNYKLRVFDSWERYPLREFIDHDIPFTISTDDPLSFGNSLNDEYVCLHNYMGFSAVELAQFAKNGFRVADLTHDQRAKWLDEIDRLVAGEIAV